MSNPFEFTPTNIIVAGDWHRNAAWGRYVIREASKFLRNEPVKIILHLGDFGIWPGPRGTWYLNELLIECIQEDVIIIFVQGNHDWPEGLEPLRIDGPNNSRIMWLPRGYRWTWYNRIWLALGGAVSLDKSRRVEGESWWPEEEITLLDGAKAALDGHADVMVTHDCPSGVFHTFPPPPAFFWESDIARSEAHRGLLQNIVNEIEPTYLMHGHLHMAYQRTVDFGYGEVEVTGLNMDGMPLNYIKLNVETMEWELVQP
jgi:Calcineurin-like phosphoesterase